MNALHWINGEWLGSENGLGHNLNPADQSVVGHYAKGSAALAQQAVERAHQAFESSPWSSSPRLRAAVLLAYADQLQKRAAEIADMIVRESGKLRNEAHHEMQLAISECRYYAGLARQIHGRSTELEPGHLALFNREAAGVVAVIVPWNAPASLLIRSLAPALAAGCTVVVKPSPQTAQVNRLMMECLAAVTELPKGVVHSVNEAGSEVGRALSEHPDVAVISFTGSSHTGKAIMAAAANTLKRLSLELGGKTPALITASANLDHAIPLLTRHATILAGQMCTAISRVIVVRERFDEVASRLSAALQQVRTGRGDDPSSTMGAIVDLANRERLLKRLEQAHQEGEVLLSGQAPDTGPLAVGAFLTPSLVHVQNLKSTLVQDELFGPIINLELAQDEDALVTRANATCYGLAASVWTKEVGQAQRLSRRIRAGTVWINTHTRQSPETETGGFGDSGLGRLHGLQGLDDFLETKTIYFEDAS
jgi:acyl-CoA reductase-like NAD-dependent aldehyde dehydrogenase